MKIFKFIKKYLTLIKEGYSLKDKITIASYVFYFLLNRLEIHKFHNLIFNVTLKNKDGIFFCGKNIFSIWTGSSFYEPELRKYFNLKKGVFIDVGANIGKYSVILGKQLGNNGKVIAFEPVPYTLKILKRNVELNELKNVTALPFALGEKEERKDFYLDAVGGSGSLLKQGVRKREKIRVTVRKLDNVLEELKINRVDLIKIDVERAEHLVLKGAVKTLKKYYPKIIFEAMNEEYLEKCKKVLDKFGYKIKQIDSENYLAY